MKEYCFTMEVTLMSTISFLYKTIVYYYNYYFKVAFFKIQIAPFWSEVLHCCCSEDKRAEIIFLGIFKKRKELRIEFYFSRDDVDLREQDAARLHFERLLTFSVISSHPSPWPGGTEILCPFPNQRTLGARPKAVLWPKAADTHFLPRIRKTRFKVIGAERTCQKTSTEEHMQTLYLCFKSFDFMYKLSFLVFSRSVLICNCWTSGSQLRGIRLFLSTQTFDS